MNNFNNNNSNVRYVSAEAAGYNSVLRNTYMLLGMTLLFSALTAGISIMLNLNPISPWIFLIGVFGLSFFVNATAESAMGILAVFLFTGFIGMYTGPILNLIMKSVHNGGNIIMTALGGTGTIFLGLSGYTLTTRKDMSSMGKFLMIGGIIGMVISIGALIFKMPAMQLVASSIFMMFASGMIMFETSNIIHGGETNYIRATVSLYMSIYNLFMSLLNILLAFRDE